MSTMKQEELDIDHFLNLDQLANPSPIPSSSLKAKAIAAPSIRTPVQTISHPSLQLQQTFSGPSHQYDLHKQQTGIPLGALAGSINANPRHGPQFGAYSQSFHTSDYLSMSDDPFDFNSMPVDGTPSFGSAEIDMDFDSPVDGIFPSSSHGSSSDFIDPNAIGGQEMNSPPTPVQREIVRLYPGMHSQQAALAKQQQQMEIQRQQQIRAAQHSQPAGSHKRTPSRTQRPPADPMVEDRISRLLNQMRQSSVGSSNNDDPTPQAVSQLAKSKKEEEDMDEDERLLASEEGKKLSSKERRQLRNKVSARAFRSRRKEYISQLEGEIANKSQEVDDLRSENDNLKAENTRLTDLTRMLLSSPAFSTFLQDLSANGVPSMPAALVNSQRSVQPPQQQPPKDANNNHQQQQTNPLVGMTMVPEASGDFASNWGTGMDYGFNAQVFSVTEIPEGPAVDVIDMDVLSGKPCGPLASFSPENKDTQPIVQPLPGQMHPENEKAVASVCDEDIEFDESDPAFALFADNHSKPKSNIVACDPGANMFGGLKIEKGLARIELVVKAEQKDESSEVSASTLAKFESICSGMTSVSERLANLTGHL